MCRFTPQMLEQLAALLLVFVSFVIKMRNKIILKLFSTGVFQKVTFSQIF